MGRPKNDAPITARIVGARGGKRQIMLTFHDGPKPRNMRIKRLYDTNTSDAKMEEHRQYWLERYLAAGVNPAAKIVAAPGADMAKWLDAWRDERIARRLTSTKDNLGHYHEHIVSSTAGAHVRDWTRDTMRKLSRDLDAKVQAGEIKWKTAQNVWGTATKMCDDAAESKHDTIKCRPENPAIGVRGPDRGDDVGHQLLYPAEFASFVAHAEVPLLWRTVVAVSVYSYLRDGELRVLTCGDVHAAQGILKITKAWNRRTKSIGSPKSGRSRDVAIEPNLMPLLEALTAGRPDHERLFPEFPSERDMARGFRRWLRRAEQKRNELQRHTPTTRPIRFHDLRGTGITWRAVRNDPKFELQYHAGHRHFSTTEKYLHLADALRRGFGEVFPALPPELVERAGTLVSDHAPDHTLASVESESVF